MLAIGIPPKNDIIALYKSDTNSKFIAQTINNKWQKLCYIALVGQSSINLMLKQYKEARIKIDKHNFSCTRTMINTLHLLYKY